MEENMKSEYFNQRIDCTVKNCKFYEKKDQKCTLGKITVSENNAICQNYEKTN